MKLVIGSRKSALARIQAYRVATALQAQAQRSGVELEIEFLFKSSMGDLQLDVSLKELPEKGVFTKDLQEDLQQGRCDCVVHSWKDLPVELPEGHQLVGTLEREDAQDVLLMKSSVLNTGLNPGVEWPQFSVEKPLCILSSSPRREHNLKSLLPELLPFEGLTEPGSLTFKEIRGNIPTRVSKMLADPEAQGLILAKAALDRLMAPLRVEDEEVTDFQKQLGGDLKQCEWMILPVRENPPAPAQGALAIETLANGDVEFEQRLALIQSTCAPFEPVGARVHNERRVLKRYGGGCHQKIGAHVFAGPDGTDQLCLRGETEAGEVLSFEGAFEIWEQRCALEAPQDAKQPNSSSQVTTKGPLKVPLDASVMNPALVESSSWPYDSSTLFERENLTLSPESVSAMGEADHWLLGRSNCWTEQVAEQFTSRSNHKPRVWVSGARSWRSLAKKGIWVSGSLESRGTVALSLNEWTQAGALSKAKLIKLTHSDAGVSKVDGIGTPTVNYASVYTLNSLYKSSEEAGRALPSPSTKFYYWMSASQLNEVLRLQPELWENSRSAGARHACGLGRSYEELRPLFEQENIELECHLSQELFLQSHGVNLSVAVESAE